MDVSHPFFMGVTVDYLFISDIIHSGESLSVKEGVKMPVQSECFNTVLQILSL